MSKRQKHAAIKAEPVTDGLSDATRLRLRVGDPGASPASAHALLARIAWPREKLAQEVERRAAEHEARTVAQPWASKIAECIAEARWMVAQDGYAPAQIRAPLERADMLVYQSKVAPLAKHGEKFKEGRKTGTVGPVRLFVRRYLAKRPQAQAADVWAAIKAKPPIGVTVHDPFELSKRQITTNAGTITKYKQFANVVSEERPKPRATPR